MTFSAMFEVAVGLCEGTSPPYNCCSCCVVSSLCRPPLCVLPFTIDDQIKAALPCISPPKLFLPYFGVVLIWPAPDDFEVVLLLLLIFHVSSRQDQKALVPCPVTCAHKTHTRSMGRQTRKENQNDKKRIPCLPACLPFDIDVISAGQLQQYDDDTGQWHPSLRRQRRTFRRTARRRTVLGRLRGGCNVYPGSPRPAPKRGTSARAATVEVEGTERGRRRRRRRSNGGHWFGLKLRDGRGWRW